VFNCQSRKVILQELPRQKLLKNPDQCAIGAILAGWRGKRQHSPAVLVGSWRILPTLTMAHDDCLMLIRSKEPP